MVEHISKHLAAFLFFTPLCVGAVALAGVIAAWSPDFNKDAQFYIQAGHVWAAGQVTYAASLVGARVFAILAYYIPQALLGASIDTLSLTLGAANLAFNATIIVFAVCVGGTTIPAFLAALAVMALGAVFPMWTEPLTENIFVSLAVAALLSLHFSRSATSHRQAVLWSCVAALICGLAYGVRAEALLLVAAVICAIVVQHPMFSNLGQRLGVALLLALIFASTSQASRIAFHAFSGTSLPAQLTSYFLFFQVVDKLGDKSAGPASAQLYDFGMRVLAEDPDQLTNNPMRLGIGKATALVGIRAASDIYFRAGIETLASRPGEVAGLVLAAAQLYTWTADLVVQLDRRSFRERRQEARDFLLKTDAMRQRVSKVRFGGDATWPVASLMNQSLPIESALSAIANVPRPIFRPPAWSISIVLLASLALAAARREWGSPLVAAALFSVAAMCLTSFSQGYSSRYWFCWMLPLSTVFLVHALPTIAGDAIARTSWPTSSLLRSRACKKRIAR